MSWRMALFALLVAGAPWAGLLWPQLVRAQAPGEADEARVGPPKSDALKVLAALQAAHEARVDESRVLREGRQEALQMKGQTARAELGAIAARQRRDEARRALAELEAQQAPLSRREAQLEALMNRVADEIHAKLDALAARTPPGAVPARPSPEPRQPEARVDAAFGRLEDAERRAQQIEVTVAEGKLEGEPRSVQVLRVGSAAAWWLALDGERAGWVEVRDGKLTLRPLRDQAGRDAVAQAVRIAKGRAAPDLVPLPLPGGEG